MTSIDCNSDGTISDMELAFGGTLHDVNNDCASTQQHMKVLMKQDKAACQASCDELGDCDCTTVKYDAKQPCHLYKKIERNHAGTITVSEKRPEVTSEAACTAMCEGLGSCLSPQFVENVCTLTQVGGCQLYENGQCYRYVGPCSDTDPPDTIRKQGNCIHLRDEPYLKRNNITCPKQFTYVYPNEQLRTAEKQDSERLEDDRHPRRMMLIIGGAIFLFLLCFAFFWSRIRRREPY